MKSCSDAQSVLDSERLRLGANFEKELLKYLGDDVEKHFRIAGHVSRCCRKKDDKSLDLLSLTIMQQALRDKELIVYTGFIAQEVEDAAQSIGYDFSGVDKPQNDNDFYGLRYAEFTVPLVKAVQVV